MLEEIELKNLIYKILILLLIYYHESMLKPYISKNKSIFNDDFIKKNISYFQTNIISDTNNTMGKKISNIRTNITSFDNSSKEQNIRSNTFIDNKTIEQNISNFTGYLEINIDNQYLYEDNIDFSNYTSELKVIAFYSPKFILIF